MDVNVHHIEIVRHLYAPGHTAFKTQGFYIIFLHLGREREWAIRGDKPPPAELYDPCGLLNVQRAADFTLKHKIGGPFIFLFPIVRCRGPPLFLNSLKNSETEVDLYVATE